MEYIGTIEVMKILNVKTRNTIYRWIALGKLMQPFTNKYGHLVWNKTDIETWKQEQLEKGFIL